VRGNATVLTLDLLPLSTPFHGFVFGNQIPANHIYWSRYMAEEMNVTVTSVTKVGDQINVAYNNGNVQPYPDWETLVAAANSIFGDPSYFEKCLLRMLVAKSPTGTNLESIVGAQINMNFSAGENAIPLAYVPPAS